MITGKHGVSATRRRYLPMALDEAQIEWVWLKSVGRPASAGKPPLKRGLRIGGTSGFSRKIPAEAGPPDRWDVRLQPENPR